MWCVSALAFPISEIYTNYVPSNCFYFRGCGPW
uniref:Uncharacterized protein n=1 Tax=Rhizophora mucronata TaxID=61149 RepID=A0A2P2LBR6_RHIMU